MPIYKTNGKKDGLQKYIVRINYIADTGQPKQLTRIAYGSDSAKDLERKLSFDLKNKSEMPVKKMTVQELFDEFKKAKEYELRKSSFVRLNKIYNHHILSMFKNYRIDRITVSDIQNWKIFMEEKVLALNTKKKVFIYFKALINYAIKMEYLNKNPFSKIGNFKDTLSIKTEMNIYSPMEFKRFITVAKKIAEKKEKELNDLSEWNYYIFFNIAFYTGLRKGEIHALKWSDINGTYLSVNRSITQKLKGGDVETAPKNKSSIRTLQLPLSLTAILEEQKQRQQLLHNFTDDFRICSSLRDTTLQNRNIIYSANAGLKTIRIHDFRHTHASILANQNINIQEIARRMGHARIEMTWNTYCHLYSREEERAIEILDSCL